MFWHTGILRLTPPAYCPTTLPLPPRRLYAAAPVRGLLPADYASRLPPFHRVTATATPPLANTTTGTYTVERPRAWFRTAVWFLRIRLPVVRCGYLPPFTVRFTRSAAAHHYGSAALYILPAVRGSRSHAAVTHYAHTDHCAHCTLPHPFERWTRLPYRLPTLRHWVTRTVCCTRSCHCPRAFCRCARTRYLHADCCGWLHTRTTHTRLRWITLPPRSSGCRYTRTPLRSVTHGCWFLPRSCRLHTVDTRVCRAHTVYCSSRLLRCGWTVSSVDSGWLCPRLQQHTHYHTLPRVPRL